MESNLEILHTQLIDALERMHIGMKGQARIDAIYEAILLYEKLIEAWAERSNEPDIPLWMTVDGRSMTLQSCRGTLRRYVLEGDYDKEKWVYEPLTPLDRISEREMNSGYGQLIDKLDMLERKGLTPTAILG